MRLVYIEVVGLARHSVKASEIPAPDSKSREWFFSHAGYDVTTYGN